MENAEKDRKQERDGKNIIFEIKKIEFERVFGHLQSLNESVSIGVAVEIFVIGILLATVSALLKGESGIPQIINLFGFKFSPLWPLGLSFFAMIIALWKALYILRQKVEDPMDENKKLIECKENPMGWLECYIKNATREKNDRHKRWKASLYLLMGTIILFSITGIAMILWGDP